MGSGEEGEVGWAVTLSPEQGWSSYFSLPLFLSTPIGHSFLGYVDLLGTTYSAPTLATGFGAAIAQPLLREAYEAKMGFDGKGELMTAEEAEKLLDECMKVLFYRDARSLNKVRLSRWW